MTDRKSASSDSPGREIDSEADSDSGFFSEAEWEDKRAGAIPFDIIHESEKGWSRVATTVLRGRRVAIKSLRPEYSGSELYTLMLEKEFELGSRLYHPAIVSYIALDDMPGLGESIIMEYIDGVPLNTIIRDRGEDLRETMRILRELCEALGYLHSHGIIHRDLKPSNIMITAAGHHVKLIDLGLAASDAFAELSFPGGTRRYSAPELLDKGRDSGPQTDIYSLGLIIREMLPRPERRVRRLIERCLSADPSGRPASAEEVMRELSGKRDSGFIGRTGFILTSAALLIATGAATVGILSSPNRESATKEVPPALTSAATVDTTSPVIAPSPTQVKAKPKPEWKAESEEVKIEEMERYARQYTLRELERHYGRDGDTLSKSAFPSWRVISELDRYVAQKSGGTNTDTYRKAKPIVTEASAATMREFHSRLYSRMKTPSSPL